MHFIMKKRKMCGHANAAGDGQEFDTAFHFS